MLGKYAFSKAVFLYPDTAMLFYCKLLQSSSGHQVVTAGSYTDSADKHKIRLITIEILHKGTHTRQGAWMASIAPRFSFIRGFEAHSHLLQGTAAQGSPSYSSLPAKQLRKADIVTSGGVARVTWRTWAGGTNPYSSGEPSNEAAFISTGTESHLRE